MFGVEWFPSMVYWDKEKYLQNGGGGRTMCFS